MVWGSGAEGAVWAWVCQDRTERGEAPDPELGVESVLQAGLDTDWWSKVAGQSFGD
jgi:hypothetical protein